MSIAKIRDFVKGNYPSETKISVNRNHKNLSLSCPEFFKDKRFGAEFSKGKLYVYPVEGTLDGVKCGYFIAGNTEVFRLVFGQKWIHNMPIMTTNKKVDAKWDTKQEAYVIDLSQYVHNAPSEVKSIEVKEKIEDVNKFTIPQASKCVQYLNAFIESERGEGFKFEILDNKLKIRKEEVIE